MYSNRVLPPPYPEKLTIALLGKTMESMSPVRNRILNCDAWALSDSLYKAENPSFMIFELCVLRTEKVLSQDQQIVDLFAVSHPGPNLFILVIQAADAQWEQVVAQIQKLQDIFGAGVTTHLVVMLPDSRSMHSFGHLKELFNVRLAVSNENLASECRQWCLGLQQFPLNAAVVAIRRKAIEIRRHDDALSRTTPGMSANADNIFNLVLLGLTGTGKSASANTILALAKLEPSEFFKSEASSMPVTTRCEVKVIHKLYRIQVRVVDTPDFFHDELQNSQAQIEECKKYCRPGGGIILLVIQVGRFTEGEMGILEKLENMLGWKIRERTFVLLTHGEDLKGSLQKFIANHEHLKKIIELCGGRFHIFNNNSKDPKQAKGLFKKIQDCDTSFPKNDWKFKIASYMLGISE